MDAGIDYGMGRTNVDVKTGIRFGVIAHNDVGQSWYDESEGQYGDPNCPSCGSAVTDEDDRCEKGFYCESCDKSHWTEECYPDEPYSFTYDKRGYEAEQTQDSPYIFVLKSPYFTRAKFCSPCMPGAGDLGSPSKDGIETYCFGHDMFDSGRAPYPVYDVETKKRVYAKKGQ